MLQEVDFTQKYIIELSGTVLNETFNGVAMSLQLADTPPGGLNPYMLIAAGFPRGQTKNSFFWNTEHSTMEARANHITCKIRPGFPATPDIHFFYFSPALFERNLTHQDTDDQQQALKTALPIKVFAQAGELSLTINSGTVSGTVWMQGYDTVEKSYVRYNATFTGRRAVNVDMEQQLQR